MARSHAAPFHVDVPPTPPPPYQCKDLERVKVLTSRAFGRGAHKEAYLAQLDGQLMVAKVPLYNRFNRYRFNTSEWNLLKTHLSAQQQQYDRHHFVNSRLHDFSKQIDEEVNATALLSTATRRRRGGSYSFVAEQLGGCIGYKYGSDQMVVQEGPLLTFAYLVGPYARIELPWSARMHLAVHLVTLITRLTEHDLVHCSLGPQQIGVEPHSLAVKVLDLGNLVRNRLDVDKRIGEGNRCTSNAQCDTEHLRCMRGGSYHISDSACRRGRCSGLDALSAVQSLCYTLLGPLLTNGAWNVSAVDSSRVAKSAVQRVLSQCKAERRADRLSPRALLAELRALNRRFDGVNALREVDSQVYRKIVNGIQRQVEHGQEACLKNVHC